MLQVVGFSNISQCSYEGEKKEKKNKYYIKFEILVKG